MSTENIDQAIGAVGAHEGFYATNPQNINQKIENENYGTNHDIEREADKIEREVLFEQFINNMSPINRPDINMRDRILNSFHENQMYLRIIQKQK